MADRSRPQLMLDELQNRSAFVGVGKFQFQLTDRLGAPKFQMGPQIMTGPINLPISPPTRDCTCAQIVLLVTH